ncbi:hypothetical protein [Rhodopirellula baltica]
MSEADGQKFLKDLDKKLWTAADKLRSNLDAAVYKHAVLVPGIDGGRVAPSATRIPKRCLHQP